MVIGRIFVRVVFIRVVFGARKKSQICLQNVEYMFFSKATYQ